MPFKHIIINQFLLLLLLCLSVTSAQATIAYRASSSNTNRGFAYLGSGTATTASSGNITLALPAGHIAGDLLICLIESADNVVPSISNSSGWTLLYSLSNGTASQASLFYKIVTSNAETNPQLTHNGGAGIVGDCAAFTGVDSTTPFDTGYAAAASVADTTVETGSLATVSPNTLLVFAAHMAKSESSLTVSSKAGLTWSAGALSTNGSGAGQSVAFSYSTTYANQGSVGPIVGTVASNSTLSNGVLLALRPKANPLTLPVNVPAGTVAGDVMLAAVAVSPTTASINTPTGWTLVRTLSNTSSTSSRLALFSRVATASEPASYTWTFSSNHAGAVAGISSFSGVDTATPINVESGKATSSSTTHSTPSITTIYNNTLLVGIFSYASSGSWTPPSGMTEAVDIASRPPSNSGGESMEISYQSQSSAGAVTAKSAKGSATRDRGATELIALKPQGAVATIDHIEISHDGSGVICAPETITIKACSNSNCSSLYSGSTTVTLTPANNTAISWASNPITFTGSTNVNLAVTSVQTVPLGSSAVSPAPVNPTTCYVNAAQNCNLPFAVSGFIFSTIPVQTAGTTSATVTIQAITGSSGGTCSGLSSGAKNIDLAFQCDDPASCAGKQVSINSTAIASNPTSAISTYTATSLTFDSASKASFTLNYPDVGKINLAARYNLGGGSYIQGSSNMFVVKPAGFAFSNIQRTADNVVNPAASSASGPLFIKAGNPFSATITAINSSGSATPNFGNETTPEGVNLDFNLVAPTLAAGGNSGSLSGEQWLDGSLFSAGAKTVTDLSWSEVGIINLRADIADADYLGAGNSSSISGNIGRFTPDHFSTTVVSACSTATPFTYSGQHADLSVAAYDANENLTSNYDTALGFAKTITFSNAGDSSGFTLNTLSSGMLNGLGTDTDVVYSFPSIPAEPTTLNIRATDTDGIVSTSLLEDTDLIYSGRLNLSNAHGSELVDLPLGLQVEYWYNNAYTVNSQDSCTTVTVPSSANGLLYSNGLNASLTTPSMNGISSGAVPLNAGIGNMVFSSPGSNNSGYIDVSLTAPAWLKFNWKGIGLVDPSARATFGLYPGDKRIVYLREVY